MEDYEEYINPYTRFDEYSARTDRKHQEAFAENLLDIPDLSPEEASDIFVTRMNAMTKSSPPSIISSTSRYLVSRFGLEPSEADEIASRSQDWYILNIKTRLSRN